MTPVPRLRVPSFLPAVKTKCAALPESVSGLVLLVLVWTGAVGLVEGPFTRKIWCVNAFRPYSQPWLHRHHNHHHNNNHHKSHRVQHPCFWCTGFPM